MTEGTSPAQKSKKGHMWLWVLLVILVIVLSGVGGCVYFVINLVHNANEELSNVVTDFGNELENSEVITPVNETTLTASQAAQALLASEDVADITELDPVRPSTIELNDHLDLTPPDTYTFYVGRSWYSIPDGNLRMNTALVKNPTAVEAVALVDQRTEGNTILADVPALGNHQVMYFTPGADNTPASVSIRFTLGTLALKTQVYSALDASASEAEVEAELVPLAKAVAQAQLQRTQSFLAGLIEAPEETRAMKAVPATLSGTSLVGIIPVTEEEWLGVTSFYGADDRVPGFSEAALGRYAITSRPTSVVEVTVLDFLSQSLAEAFRDQLLTGNFAATGTVVPLTGDLAVAGDAISHDTITELQMVKGHYVIDVSIFSPFDVFDATASNADLVTMSQEIFTNFSAK